MGLKMDMESLLMQMVLTIKAILRMIKCKEKELYSMVQGDLLMKVIG